MLTRILSGSHESEENLEYRPKLRLGQLRLCCRKVLPARCEGSNSTPCRCQRRVMRGQSAKPVALDLQRTIESRAHILERDSRGQIDDLLSIEMALEFLEDLVGNVDRASVISSV